MGNSPSNSSGKGDGSSRIGGSGSGGGGGRSSRSKQKSGATDLQSKAQKVAADLQASMSVGLRKLEENDHPAAHLIDSFCGPYLDAHHKYESDYEDEEDDDEEEEEESSAGSLDSEDETTTATEYVEKKPSKQKQQQQRGRDRKQSVSGRSSKDGETVESSSYLSQSDYGSQLQDRPHKSKSSTTEESSMEADYDRTTTGNSTDAKTLVSAFAKRCYFTKQGIGPNTQHYEGLTLTGNVVLMLAAAMKLKGCPTICDEDLRRVEQTYPNQFCRLPDELLLSSGWRRISKYCHFSSRAIPDGVPFFHSKERIHPSGGFYFLLAAAVGMVRPCDVEPLNRDTLVLLETDFPVACDTAPPVLIQDPAQWVLVDKFCFFSGGPINTDEDVYYQADFDGNPIFMLAFLSPSLTPEELYKLDGPNGLESVAQVEEVESIYDLTERDFEDLKLYHLGPCRALPPYILQPQSWTKILPRRFLMARETALRRAHDFDRFEEPSPQAYGSQYRYAPQHFRPPTTTYGSEASTPHFPSQPPVMHHPYGPPGVHPYGSAPSQVHAYSDPMYADQRNNEFRPESVVLEDPRSYNQAYGSQPVAYSVHHPIVPTPTTTLRSASPGLRAASPARGTYALSQTPSVNTAVGSGMNIQVSPQRLSTGEISIPQSSGLLYMPSPLKTKTNLRSKPDDDEDRPDDEAKGLDPPEDQPPSLSRRDSDPSDEDDYGTSPEKTATEDYDTYKDEFESPHKSSVNDQQVQRKPPSTQFYVMHRAEEQTMSPVSENDFLSPGNSADEPSSRVGLSKDYVEEDEEFEVDNDNQEDMKNLSDSPKSSPVSALLPNKPPKSPGSDYSRTSSAMKGAQELLKRNRQRRLEASLKQDPQTVASPPSEATYDSGSEMTSIVSGSSVWTDNVSNPDRSSRRALILQMAKARMRNIKHGGSEEEKKIGEDIDLELD